MKKLGIFLLFFFVITANAYAGGCSCASSHEPTTASDRALGSSKICSGFHLGQRMYGDKGSVLVCRVHDIGNNGCDGKCRKYKYEWSSMAGACGRTNASGVPTDHDDKIPKSANDMTIDWVANPWPWVCWRPVCRAEGQYWVGKISEGHASINYDACQACRLTMVEIVDSDPTEISYIKIKWNNTGSGVGSCPVGSTVDSGCTGFRKRGADVDNKCAKKSCVCSGIANEYPEVDGDRYVRCGTTG